MFGRLKDFRRIASRYDRLAHNFLAAVCIAATLCLLVMRPDPSAAGATPRHRYRDLDPSQPTVTRLIGQGGAVVRTPQLNDVAHPMYCCASLSTGLALRVIPPRGRFQTYARGRQRCQRHSARISNSRLLKKSETSNIHVPYLRRPRYSALAAIG